MLLTYRYQLWPTKGQRRRLEALLEAERQLYNAALEERIDAWTKHRKAITRIDQFKSLTTIRADHPDTYGNVAVNISRWTLKRLEDAFTGFFSRVKHSASKAGFPRFRIHSRWRSFGLIEWSGARMPVLRLPRQCRPECGNQY